MAKTPHSKSVSCSISNRTYILQLIFYYQNSVKNLTKWVLKLCGTPGPGNTAKAHANAVPALTDMDWSASTTWICAVSASGSMPRILDSRSWINTTICLINLLKRNTQFLNTKKQNQRKSNHCLFSKKVYSESGWKIQVWSSIVFY